MQQRPLFKSTMLVYLTIKLYRIHKPNASFMVQTLNTIPMLMQTKPSITYIINTHLSLSTNRLIVLLDLGKSLWPDESTLDLGCHGREDRNRSLGAGSSPHVGAGVEVDR